MKHIQNHTQRLARWAWNSTFFIGCLAVPVAHAAITFQFEYDDPVGTGFRDPVYGPARQAALNTAANTFSSMFGSHFSNSGTITLQATASDDSYSATMASAGSVAIPSSNPGFNLGEVVRTKLQNNGLDLNGDKADGAVNVNFAKLWNLDLNTPTASNQYDFYNTIYHEFTHALGFSSTIGESGASMFEKPSWNSFDSFITDKYGNKIIDPVTFALDHSAWDAGKVGDWGGGGSEGLFFDGPNAVAANGGHLITLYTPSEWNEGSSVSHLDDRMSGIEGTMMSPFTETGPRIHDYSAVEVGILTDLGYAPAVPEAETYSMMLAGLATCAWITRRRKIENSLTNQ